MKPNTLLPIFILAFAAAPAQSTAPEPTSELRNYQNWSVQCKRTEAEQKSCALFQRLLLKNGQMLVLFRIEKDVIRNDQEPPVNIGVFSLPVGVHLPSGLTVQVDENEPAKLVYERCDPVACHAGTVLDESWIRLLKKGEICKVSFNDLSGKTVTVTLSLRGFSAGFNSF